MQEKITNSIENKRVSHQPKKKILIVLAGPTAVGKTRVAIELAKHFGTEIVSADSRQIYQGMDIGTAKPGPAELAIVKHHLIDVVPITKPFTVSDFEREAIDCIASVHSRNDVCILAGGSGLYLKAVTEGLDIMPDVPQQVRNEIEKKWRQHGLEWLQQKLASVDPEYFQIVDVNNPRRLIRALSFHTHTHEKISSYLNAAPKKRAFGTIPILLILPREVLYQRINQRVDHMIALGLKEEAKALWPYSGLQALATVGYQEFFALFNGEIDQREAVRLIKRNSRRYAKRQMTWFRRYGDWTESNPDDLQEMIKLIGRMMTATEKLPPSPEDVQ